MILRSSVAAEAEEVDEREVRGAEDRAVSDEGN